MKSVHTPVLLDEIIGFINRPATRVVIDATLGGGGHAEAMLTHIDGIERLIGFDRDRAAVERCQKRLARFGDRVTFIKESFHKLADILGGMNIGGVDALLMDLGVSSYQLDEAERGFSFGKEGALDMRMDRDQPETAADIVGSRSVEELSRIFAQWGEERFAFRIARAIVDERAKEPITDTLRLARIITANIPRKIAATSPIHPATRVFQALRIAVNDELAPLRKTLEAGIRLLNPGGRIAVISFHSLEDRIVKQTFVDFQKRCVCPKGSPLCNCGEPGLLRRITKKPVIASEPERNTNPRSRSAKLRVAERLVS